MRSDKSIYIGRVLIDEEITTSINFFPSASSGFILNTHVNGTGLILGANLTYEKVLLFTRTSNFLSKTVLQPRYSPASSKFDSTLGSICFFFEAIQREVVI